MADAGDISSDEVILKRVKRDSPNCVQLLPSGVQRATSFAIRNRPGEVGSSCSRLCLTSPRKLLDLVRLQDLDPDDFLVCRIRVADVRELRLDVIALETNDDAGHCEIRATAQQSFSPKIWSRLAKTTRILNSEEVRQLQAGDALSE
jgi:hypothetical protein